MHCQLFTAILPCLPVADCRTIQKRLSPVKQFCVGAGRRDVCGYAALGQHVRAAVKSTLHVGYLASLRSRRAGSLPHDEHHLKLWGNPEVMLARRAYLSRNCVTVSPNFSGCSQNMLCPNPSNVRYSAFGSAARNSA